MFVSLVCLACTYQEFMRMPDLERKISQTIETQCFSAKMREANADPFWLSEIQGAQLEIPVEYYDETDPSYAKRIAYMDPGLPNMHLNRDYFDSFTNCKRASVISHETLHFLGYRHFADSAYAVNFAFESCCAK